MVGFCYTRTTSDFYYFAKGFGLYVTSLPEPVHSRCCVAQIWFLRELRRRFNTILLLRLIAKLEGGSRSAQAKPFSYSHWERNMQFQKGRHLAPVSSTAYVPGLCHQDFILASAPNNLKILQVFRRYLTSCESKIAATAF